MSVELISAFRTSDGEVFQLESDAQDHQRELDFDKWYVEGRLRGNYAGSFVDLPDIKDWLRSNKSRVLNLLNEVDAVEFKSLVIDAAALGFYVEGFDSSSDHKRVCRKFEELQKKYPTLLDTE